MSDLTEQLLEKAAGIDAYYGTHTREGTLMREAVKRIDDLKEERDTFKNAWKEAHIRIEDLEARIERYHSYLDGGKNGL